MKTLQISEQMCLQNYEELYKMLFLQGKISWEFKDCSQPTVNKTGN